MKSIVGVLRFPGTQCDEDVKKVLNILNLSMEWIWYNDSFSYNKYAGFILPGGFSYGDYLRAGALASESVAMHDVYKAGKSGWPILGICNGFQILCEVKLLEGTLQINQNLRFIDKWVRLKQCNPCKLWGGNNSEEVSMPIAHGEGRFYASEEQVQLIKDEGRIWWKYCHNPNGSVEDIAGIMNKKGNVAGLMPHPERAVADWMGGTDGLSFFKTFI